MSTNDYIKMAKQIMEKLAAGQPFKLPLMTVKDLGKIVRLLRAYQRKHAIGA